MVEKLLPIERLDVGLGDLVVTAVREAISAGSLAAGQRITERELVDVLTRIVVDVGETSGVELELSSSSARNHGGLSCLTLMPG